MKRHFRFTVKQYVSIFLLVFGAWSTGAVSQINNNADNSAGGWGMKIFHVDSSAYPFVSAYIRTSDGNQNPLRNVNAQNIGVLVKGKTYSPFKQQYTVRTVKQAQIPVRTVILVDASATMAGAPFESTLSAALDYINEKEPNDQIAIVEMNDTKQGYSVVSSFTNDARLLGGRLGGIQAVASKTKIYDSVGAALQMCRSAGGEKNSSSEASAFASCSLIIFSDGADTGSALTRADLISALSNRGVPVPIHSLGYTKTNPVHLKNLQALSEISFGRFYDASESLGSMNSAVQNLQAIGKNDLVVTFRSYLDVDGEEHAFKVGIEYPSNSGRITYDGARFEAMESIPVQKIDALKAAYSKVLPELSDGDPHMKRAGEKDVLVSQSSEEKKPWWKFW